MTDKKVKATPDPESVQEVARIREIIFGGQMREYQQQFESVQRDLDRLQQELARLNDQLSDQGSDQSKRVQDLRRELRQANDDLRDELRQRAKELMVEKVDRVALGELFIQLGTQLKTGGSLADLLKGLEEEEAE
jgi:septal ring factor EnvC (AmiA/AmiB activator)